MRPFKRLAGPLYASHYWGERSLSEAPFGYRRTSVAPRFLGTLYNYVSLINQAQSLHTGVWHVRRAGWELRQSWENKHCLERGANKVELRSNVISTETKLYRNGLAVLCRLGRARKTHPVCFWLADSELWSCTLMSRQPDGEAYLG